MMDKWDELLERLHSDDFDVSWDAGEYCEDITLPEEKIAQWLFDENETARATAIRSCEELDNPWEYLEIALQSDDELLREAAEEQCIIAINANEMPRFVISKWLRSDNPDLVNEALELCGYLDDADIPWEQIETAIMDFEYTDKAMEVVYNKNAPLEFVDRWFVSDDDSLVQAGVEAVEGNGFPDYLMEEISVNLLKRWKNTENEDVQSVTEQVCSRKGISYDAL